MQTRPRFRLLAFILFVLGVGSAVGLLARGLRSPPDPHSHAGGGYVLHNESEWAVALRVEPPMSRSRYIRLMAGESYVLPRKPLNIAVMSRGANPPHGSKDYPMISIDLSRSGAVSHDYGFLHEISNRCLAVRMFLGRGAEPTVE
jgi:hypothetical protein